MTQKAAGAVMYAVQVIGGPYDGIRGWVNVDWVDLRKSAVRKAPPDRTRVVPADPAQETAPDVAAGVTSKPARTRDETTATLDGTDRDKTSRSFGERLQESLQLWSEPGEAVGTLIAFFPHGTRVRLHAERSVGGVTYALVGVNGGEKQGWIALRWVRRDSK
jgi:hypothetical protein